MAHMTLLSSFRGLQTSMIAAVHFNNDHSLQNGTYDWFATEIGSTMMTKPPDGSNRQPIDNRKKNC